MVLLCVTLKGGNYLGSGIGILFIVLERRILDGEPGFFPRGTSLALSLPVHVRKDAAG